MNDQEWMDKMCLHWGGAKAWRINERIYVAMPLMFHWALIVDVDTWGYGERYCYATLEKIEAAMVELEKPTVGFELPEKYDGIKDLRYWHKDHTKGLSVYGDEVYRSGDDPRGSTPLFKVNWFVDTVADPNKQLDIVKL